MPLGMADFKSLKVNYSSEGFRQCLIKFSVPMALEGKSMVVFPRDESLGYSMVRAAGTCIKKK